VYIAAVSTSVETFAGICHAPPERRYSQAHGTRVGCRAVAASLWHRPARLDSSDGGGHHVPFRCPVSGRCFDCRLRGERFRCRADHESRSGHQRARQEADPRGAMASGRGDSRELQYLPPAGDGEDRRHAVRFVRRHQDADQALSAAAGWLRPRYGRRSRPLVQARPQGQPHHGSHAWRRQHLSSGRHRLRRQVDLGARRRTVRTAARSSTVSTPRR